MKINYVFNKATEQQIKDHLWRVDADFVIPLHSYADIAQYARKLAASAIRVESFVGGNLVGLLAVYYNSEKQFIFGSNFSIEKEYRGKGMELFNVLLNAVSKPQDQIDISPEMQQVSDQFLRALAEVANPKKLVIKSIHTEVHNSNRRLILYYRRLGFKEVETINESVYLIKEL